MCACVRACARMCVCVCVCVVCVCVCVCSIHTPPTYMPSGTHPWLLTMWSFSFNACIYIHTQQLLECGPPEILTMHDLLLMLTTQCSEVLHSCLCAASRQGGGGGRKGALRPLWTPQLRQNEAHCIGKDRSLLAAISARLQQLGVLSCSADSLSSPSGDGNGNMYLMMS